MRSTFARRHTYDTAWIKSREKETNVRLHGKTVTLRCKTGLIRTLSFVDIKSSIFHAVVRGDGIRVTELYIFAMQTSDIERPLPGHDLSALPLRFTFLVYSPSLRATTTIYIVTGGAVLYSPFTSPGQISDGRNFTGEYPHAK